MNIKDARKKLTNGYFFIIVDTDSVECAGCKAYVPLKQFENQNVKVRFEGVDDMLICELCASSRAGNAVSYPTQYPQADVLQTINSAANAILTHTGKFETVPKILLTYEDFAQLLKREPTQ